MKTEYTSSTTQCVNADCGKFFPSSQAVWITEVFTACSNSCALQFVRDKPETVKRYANSLGMTLEDVRGLFAK